MNAVCEYCGKAKGWHVWGCPNLELLVKFNNPPREMIVEDAVDVAMLETLPEVE